jgi:hypothetical protein
MFCHLFSLSLITLDNFRGACGGAANAPDAAGDSVVGELSVVDRSH